MGQGYSISSADLGRKEIRAYPYCLLDLKDQLTNKTGHLGDLYRKLNFIPHGTNFSFYKRTSRNKTKVSNSENLVIRSEMVTLEVPLIELMYINILTEDCMVYLTQRQCHMIGILLEKPQEKFNMCESGQLIDLSIVSDSDGKCVRTPLNGFNGLDNTF